MIKIISHTIENVADLIDALHKLDPYTPITPFGDSNTVVAYDDETKVAYLDNRDCINGLDNAEYPVSGEEVDGDYDIEEASY